MKRTVTVNAEMRSEQREGQHVIIGHAAMYGVLSQVLYHAYGADGKRRAVREKLAVGAFDEADISDVTCNRDHNDTYLLGRTDANTLTILRDQVGLGYECQVADTSYARDIGVLMQRGDLRQNSFAFTVSDEHITREVVGEEIHETVHKVQKVYDVAVVTRGAYTQPYSVFRAMPTEGETFTIQDMAFRYSQEAKPAASTREGDEAGEHSALRTQNEALRTLALARLDITDTEMRGHFHA